MPWRRWSGAEGQGPEVEVLREEIRAGLEEAERDVRLRQELVEVRANQYDVGPEGTDAAYATAFRDAGLDLDALEPAEFARRLGRQPEAVVIEVSAFLDDWSAVRREAKRPVAAWRKPMEAARLADREPYRDRLRAILLAEDRKPQAEARSRPWPRPPSRPSCRRPRPSCSARPWRASARPRPPWPCCAPRPAATPATSGSTTPWPGPWTSCDRRPARRRCGTTRRPARCARDGARAGPPARSGWAAATEAEAVFRDLTDRRPEDARHLDGLGLT